MNEGNEGNEEKFEGEISFTGKGGKKISLGKGTVSFSKKNYPPVPQFNCGYFHKDVLYFSGELDDQLSFSE